VASVWRLAVLWPQGLPVPGEGVSRPSSPGFRLLF